MRRLLIIGAVWPEPKSSAAGSRMMQLIQLFKSNACKITFASSSAKTQNAFDLESIDVDEINIKLNHSSFDTFVKALNPDIVLFDRFMTEEQFGWRIAEQCPNALRLLDTEDLHFLRKGRHQALKDNKPFDKIHLFNETAKREIASIYRSDLSLIISKAEMAILKEHFSLDENSIHYLPFLLNTISTGQIDASPQFEERTNFITIGNFLHEPNWDSIKYLKQTIWPLIRKQLPNAELNVYGAYSTIKVDQLHNERERFLIKGFAENVNTVMSSARVCLAPLRFGAGLKGKLIDAMCNGTPFVTTPIGAEGLFLEDANNAVIQDSPEDFANSAVNLYTNKQHWEECQKLGFQIINEHFNKTGFINTFLQKLEDIQNHLQEHRQKNFVGQLLQHHTLQSTKYMSKWIEEKNKKP